MRTVSTAEGTLKHIPKCKEAVLQAVLQQNRKQFKCPIVDNERIKK